MREGDGERIYCIPPHAGGSSTVSGGGSVFPSSWLCASRACSSGMVPCSFSSPANGSSDRMIASSTCSDGLLIGAWPDGFVIASSALCFPHWNQPPFSHSPGWYRQSLRMSVSTTAAISLFSRSKAIGFRIHASKPASMYCCRSLSIKEAETAMMGTRPQRAARGE
jgi:hypothetical protein